MTRNEGIMGKDCMRRVNNAAEMARRRSKAERAKHYGILREWVEGGGLCALTIHQPYAYWIMNPDGDELAKRVENRSWEPPRWLIGKRLVIHSGLSKTRLAYGDTIKWPLVFGAGLGTVKVVGSLRKMQTGSPASGWECDEFPQGYEWLATHRHCEGPVCWVLADPRPFTAPIQAGGAQGLWKWKVE